MSTKIYYAVKIPTTDLSQIEKILVHLKRGALEPAKARLNKWWGSRLYHAMDQIRVDMDWKKSFSYFQEEIEKRYVSCAEYPLRLICDALIVKRGELKRPYAERDPTCDIDPELTIFPHKDCCLILVRSEMASVHRDTLLNYSGLDIVEYGYWNNTDQPEELSDSEWRQRERDWDDVIDNDILGVFWEGNLRPDEIFGDMAKNNELRVLEDFEQRVHQLVYTWMQQNDPVVVKQLKILNEQIKQKDFNLSGYIRLEKEMKTFPIYAIKYKEFSQILPKSYTYDDFISVNKK